MECFKVIVFVRLPTLLKYLKILAILFLISTEFCLLVALVFAGVYIFVA